MRMVRNGTKVCAAVLPWVMGITAAHAQPAQAAAPVDDSQLREGQAALMFSSKVLNPEAAGTKLVDMQKILDGGKKAVILSFFATYCEPCKKELPFLERMHQKYKDAGLAVVVVSIDQKPEDIAKVGDLTKENGITYPVASDRFNIVAKRYGVKRLPCLYILDGNGKVSLVNTGYSEEFGGQLLAAVQTRLGVPLDPNAVPHPDAAPPPAAAAAAPAFAAPVALMEADKTKNDEAPAHKGKKAKGKKKSK